MTNAIPASEPFGVARRARLTAGRALLLLPILLLGVPAATKFFDGLRIDAAFPVPVYVQMNVKMPKASYQKGVALLKDVSDGGGDLTLAAAEAASDIPLPPAQVAALAKDGLARMPGSARGWLVLSAAERQADPALSARALALSYQLAPFDYWIAGWRAQSAADFWNNLDETTKKSAVWQTKLLWTEPLLRQQFAQLLRSPSGRALVKRVYRNDPDVIGAINRWTAWWSRHSGRH